MGITNTTKTGQLVNSLSKNNKIAEMIKSVAHVDGQPNDFTNAYREYRNFERREDIEKVKDFERKHRFKAGDYVLDFDQVMQGTSASEEPETQSQVTLPDDAPDIEDRLTKERNLFKKYVDDIGQAIENKFSKADDEMAQGEVDNE